MSVLNPISILPYAGLNATGPYAITFDVFLDDGGNAKDITVLLLSGGAITDITAISTVTGKNVYTSASYTSSDTVVLLRDPLFTQPYVYSGVTQFPGRTVEKSYDRLLFLIQRLRLDVERSLKFPLTDLPARDMPAKALMALQGLFFDADGEATPTGGLTNIPISNAMEPVVTALTLVLARATLDVYGKSDSRPAEKVSLADAGNRYTAEQAEAAFQEIAGAGRTTETVKGNADAIAAIKPPIGYLYIQFPDKSAPGNLWGGTWTDISATWAGRFFRAVGGNAAAFGDPQNDAFQGHEHDYGLNVGGVLGSPYNAYIVGVGSGAEMFLARAYSEGSILEWGGQGTPRTAIETRSINYAIKIWERTA